ncbi:MAG: cysteine--tRNA ligase [Candidatus Geothermincolia bacterium]
MAIRIFNTMTRKKEELVPREEGKLSMYVCGPTVYNLIHIGNARTFLNFDMIRRYLEHRGFEVTFVQNITDVDDKIINKANEEGIAPAELADKYRRDFEQDMAALGVKPPDIAPRATQHISEMLEVIGRLVEKGYAYESEGDVYFEVEKFDGYGKLSGRTLEDQQHGMAASVDADRKRGPWDFALWKAAKPGEPSWESPWGPGRPGWHIECSTMSVKYLGDGFDVHGGGLDLVFPHHENEIAQAEACSGHPFVRYWLHSGMLNIDMEKMSKSLGNIKSLREVLEEYDAQAVRMMMLGTHYRGPLNFSDESLRDARASLERISNCRFNLADLVARTKDWGGGMVRTDAETTLVYALNDYQAEFLEHMDDDFNSAAALGVLFEVVREINTHCAHAIDMKTPCAKLVLLECQRVLEEMCEALGLFQPVEAVPEQLAEGEAGVEGGDGIGAPAGDSPTREELIDLLLKVRQAARETKNFGLSDQIRDGLAELGVRVEDVRDGYRWRLER